MKIKLKDFLKSEKEIHSGSSEHFLAILKKMPKQEENEKEVVSPYFLNFVSLRKTSSAVVIFVFAFVLVTTFNKSDNDRIVSLDPEPSVVAVNYSEDTPMPASMGRSFSAEGGMHERGIMAAPARMEIAQESQPLEDVCSNVFSCTLQKIINFVRNVLKK